MRQYLSRMKHFIYLLPLVWLLLTIAVMVGTSPLQVGPAGILLVFVLFYVFASSILFDLIFFSGKAWNKMSGKSFLSARTSYFVASAIALGPVFMVALNTLGQLGIVEIILVMVLIAVACFYIVRRSN